MWLAVSVTEARLPQPSLTLKPASSEDLSGSSLFICKMGHITSFIGFCEMDNICRAGHALYARHAANAKWQPSYYMYHRTSPGGASFRLASTLRNCICIIFKYKHHLNQSSQLSFSRSLSLMIKSHQ